MAHARFSDATVRAAFALAVIGWGLGFYGPPIFLHEVVVRTGWAESAVAWAVTAHHLSASAVVLMLPRLHARFGVGAVATAGLAMATAGIAGWSVASDPAQLAMAALLSGSGWATTGASAINALMADRSGIARAAALTTAYNGASIGGAIFSIAWPSAIAAIGFTRAALVFGVLGTTVVACLWRLVLPRDSGRALRRASAAPAAKLSWHDARLRSLAIGMCCALFAQIGLMAHLFTLLVPRLGERGAGWLVGASVAWAIAGRSMAWHWGLARGANPRSVAALFLIVQAAGSLILALLPAQGLAALVAGSTLIGLGIGNATSLPAVAAQQEFAGHAQRAIAVIVAMAQATYSFAPAVFGLLLASASGTPVIGPSSAPMFLAACALQAIAAAAMWRGRATARAMAH